MQLLFGSLYDLSITDEKMESSLPNPPDLLSGSEDVEMEENSGKHVSQHHGTCEYHCGIRVTGIEATKQASLLDSAAEELPGRLGPWEHLFNG